MILLWLARAGWLLAAWALIAGRPQVVAIGLMLVAPHVALWVTESEPAPVAPPAGVDVNARCETCGYYTWPAACPCVVAQRRALVERWGPRPDVMTRCVECGRNVWPACRCALIRAGFPMTADHERTDA